MKGTNVNRPRKYKPSRGMRQFEAQNRKAVQRREARKVGALKKSMMPKGIKEKLQKLSAWYNKSKHLKGKYTPHQGEQEKARRRRQMGNHGY